MSYETILFEREGAVARITLNRPKEMNAINPQLADELFDALLASERDETVRSVLMTGTGRAFSAGGDVPAFHANLDGATTFIKKLTQGFHACISQITRMPKPVVAGVNGITAGGGMGFALAPDLVIAAESARFTMAYTGIAAAPDGSTSFFLPRLIGVRRAMELAMLNRPVRAEEALAWGIVNMVVPDDKLADEAMNLARRLAAGPTLAFAQVKKLMNQSMHTSLDTQLEDESRAISSMGGTEDFKEGVRAFVEKRRPEFRGR